METSIYPDIAKLKRNLIKKIEKAKPIVLQVEKGELVCLDATQQHMIENYQSWVESLGYLKKGEMPPPKPVVETKECKDALKGIAITPSATYSHEEEGNTENINNKVNITHVAAEHQKGKNKDDKSKNKNKINAQPNATKRAIAAKILQLPDVDPIIFEWHTKGINALTVQLLKVNNDTKKALIDLVVKFQINNASLEKHQKEYDALCTLKNDIMSGKIQNPTVVQKSRLNLIEMIEKEIQLETQRMESQATQYRSDIIAALEKAGGSIESPLECPSQPDEGEECAGATNTMDAIMSSEVDAEEKDDSNNNNEIRAFSVETEAKLDDNETEETPKKEKSATDVIQTVHMDGEHLSWASLVDTPTSQQDLDYNKYPTEGDNVTEMGEDKLSKSSPESPLSTKQADHVPESYSPKKIDWSDITIIRNKPRAPKLDQKVLTNEEWETMCNRKEHCVDYNQRNVTPATLCKDHNCVDMRNGGHNISVNIFKISNFVVNYEEIKKMLNCEKRYEGNSTDRDDVSNEYLSEDTSNKMSSYSPQSLESEQIPKISYKQYTSTKTSKILQDSVVSRVQREVQFCMRNTFQNVRFITSESSVLKWYVNVSPLEGPLTGVIIPLEIIFGSLYPQDPPQVRVKIEIVHPSIVVECFRDSLCFEHTKPKNWSPSYGAYSILSQLQNFFNTENFGEKIVLPEIKKKIKISRGECTRYINKDINHYPFHPNPALPVFNGPFEKTTLKVSSDSSLSGPGSGTWLHAYGASGGVHRFSVTITAKTEDSAYVDVGCVAPNGATGERVGDDAYGWAFCTQTGVLKTRRKPWKETISIVRPFLPVMLSDDEHDVTSSTGCGSVTSRSSSMTKQSNVTKILSNASVSQNASIKYPLGVHRVIEFTIDFNNKTLCVKVDDVVVHHDCPIPHDIECLHPTIHIPDSNIKCLLMVAIHTESLEQQNAELLKLRESSDTVQDGLWSSVSTAPLDSFHNMSFDGNFHLQSPTISGINVSGCLNATDTTDERDSFAEYESQGYSTNTSIVLQLKPLSCFVTMATPNPSIIGALVEVKRNSTTFMPTSVSSANVEYISTDAFAKHRSTKLQWGRRIDAYIPLMLDKEHATNAFPYLKTAITMLCRNPDASTMYIPPFKVKNVLPVLSLAMLGCLEESDRRPLACRMVSYGQYFHCLVALCVSEENVKEEILTVIKDCKNGMMPQSSVSPLVLMHLSPILTTDTEPNLWWETAVKIAIASFCVSQGKNDKEKKPLSSNPSDTELSKLYSSLSMNKRCILSCAVLFTKVVYRAIMAECRVLPLLSGGDNNSDSNSSIHKRCFSTEECFESLCRQSTTIPSVDLLWGQCRYTRGLPVTITGLIEMISEGFD